MKGIADMAQELWTLAEDLGYIPRMHILIHNYV